MEKLIKFSASKIKLIVLIYVLIQLTLILTSNITYQGDSLYYYKLAQECVSLNEFYPAEKHLYEDYIVAPSYINGLIIILHIFNSTISVGLFNLLIIFAQLILVYKITKKFFSEETAQLVVLLFVLNLNTTGMVLQNFTELFFTLLITLSFYLFSLKKNIYFILSGAFIGAAIAVRPLGWALLAALILAQIFYSIKERKLYSKYSYVYIGTLIFILTFGGIIYSHFGRFEFTSTTGPVNLLIGANDDATGGFNATVHQPGKSGYIENSNQLTYIQKGEFYEEQAVKWIKENPDKWLLLPPIKLLHAYGWDDVAISTLLGFDDTNFLRVIRILYTEKNLEKALPDKTTNEKVIYLLVLTITHLFYYFLLIAAAIGIYKMFRQKNNNELFQIILLFILFATVMIMITVGTPRYKYPMFILLLPFAAYYLQTKFKLGVIKVGKD
jgi:4-amino-4-deoxy-L-arabinose transferase-like glycosyltransferase